MKITQKKHRLNDRMLVLGAVELPDPSLLTFMAALEAVRGLLPPGVSALDVNMECYGGIGERVRLVEESMPTGKEYSVQTA